MRLRLSLPLILLSTTMLSACVNDSASYVIDGNLHAISLRGHQEYFWDEQLTLTLVATHLPDCSRQLPLGQVPISEFDVELYQSGADGYILRQGKKIWGVETARCTLLDEPGKAALGAKLGAFKIGNDSKLVFEEAPAAAAPAVATPAAPAAGEPAAAAPAAPAAEAAAAPAPDPAAPAPAPAPAR